MASTTRQVDPEWDAEDRGKAEGLARYEREVCPGCHIHPIMDDAPGAMTWEDRLCKFCRAGAVHGRVLAAKDEEWNKANPEPKPEVARPYDGRLSSLRPMSPQEVAEKKRRRRR